MRTENGIHTFSLVCRSSYTEIQNIVGAVPCVTKADKYHLNISRKILKFKSTGVEIHLYQSLVHPSWIKLIVNPSSLLADGYCPTELFCEPDEISDVKKRLREILDKCGIDCRLKKFKLSRCDLTRNQYYDSKKELSSQLDRFRKSYVMPRYKVDADEQFWTIFCKSCEFSAYNKSYELDTRHDILIDHNILRLELRLERKRIRQVVKKQDWEDALAGLCKRGDTLLDRFIHRLYQDFEDVVTKETALEKIEKSSFREKTKKSLCKIVNLANACTSLNTVQKKMRLKSKDFKRLLNKFYKLGIHPVTNSR